MEGGGILSAAALFLLGTLQALHAQKNPFLEQIRNFPQEKIHVTTDRDAYIAGDTVWLRAHCVDAATLEPLTASRYVYVELRTTDNLLVRRIKILQRGGVYAGYLPLPATLAQDEYVLCAYTLYMRNLGGDYLFSKPLSVNPYRQPEKRRRRTAAGPFDVAFFPEGGYLIDGQPCRVGFKALGKDGLSRQVTGTVRDDRGRTVARFASRHAGMGSFEFTPRPGRRYTAECVQTSGGKSRRFDLPEANDLTFVLRVEPNDTSFVVSVRSAKKWRPQGLKLLVHRCGTQCYYKEWNPQHASLTFLRDELPGGLYQILLLSPTGEAYSERLVFNRRDEEAEVTMRQEGTLQQRSKVTLHFEVRDTKRRPAQGDFTVAVTDRKAAAPVATAGIYSTLMLSSELRGVIEDPPTGTSRPTTRRATRDSTNCCLRRAGAGTTCRSSCATNTRSPITRWRRDRRSQDASSARPCSPKRRSSTATRCGCWYPRAATPPRLPSPRTGRSHSTGSTSPTARPSCCAPPSEGGQSPTRGFSSRPIRFPNTARCRACGSPIRPTWRRREGISSSAARQTCGISSSTPWS